MAAAGRHRAGDRTRAGIAAIALIVWALVAAQPALGLTRERQLALLQRYQPVTWFATAELFTPTNVATFEVRSRLLWRDGAGSFTTAAPGSTSPTPDEIAAARNVQCDPGLRHPCWMLDQKDCTASGGVAAGTLACYQNAWQAASPLRVVYGRVARGRTGWALQYWYFSYDEPFQPVLATAGTAQLWTQHEGDWEAVTVVVSRSFTPRWVAYSNHCLGLRRPWAGSPRIGRHPVAHVARGSHAGWFGAGIKRIPRAADCLPASDDATLDAGHVTVSDTADEGSVSGPPGLPGLGAYQPTGIILLTSAQSWIAYPGTWGERRYVDLVVNGSTVHSGAFGFSPRGPAGRGRLWAHPIGATRRWPTDYSDLP
ncbi:MAG TPA: hypothetical protein VE777_05000 [Gaiellales bacterium]|nr:hypothetical protein [Gaiellales bacterium]